MITTLVDASGLFIYFTVARLMIASLSASPIVQDLPAWQSAEVVAHSDRSGVLKVKASADPKGHVQAITIDVAGSAVDVAPTWITSLPPLELATLSLRGDGPDNAHELYVSFATGGKDNEHVRFVIRRGVVTEVDITKVSSEGKEHVEVRAPPAR